jgi:UDP-GlcNAc:undecaprenyl-phosphate GlcNAc-1-phosphate transferase
MEPRLGGLLIAGSIAAVVSLGTTVLAARLAARLRVLDHPTGYKSHGHATPLLGGLGVVAGTLAGVAGFLPRESSSELAGILALGIGALVILLAGLLDDVNGLSPQRKFAWQVSAAAAAGLCLALLGVRLDLFLPWPPLPILALTVLWVIAITNALNFLDNMDGLCAGLGAIAACSLAVVNLRSGEYAVALAAASLSGACLGFLPHNWPRARVFLGDTGAMFIGFTLAGLSVMGVYTRGARVPMFAVLTPLFVLAVPVLDAVLVVVLRLRAGHPPWIGDRRHLSHRLVRRGLRPPRAVVALWLAGTASGLAALLLPTVGPAEAPLLLALLCCALGALAVAAGTDGLP